MVVMGLLDKPVQSLEEFWELSLEELGKWCYDFSAKSDKVLSTTCTISDFDFLEIKIQFVEKGSLEVYFEEIKENLPTTSWRKKELSNYGFCLYLSSWFGE